MEADKKIEIGDNLFYLLWTVVIGAIAIGLFHAIPLLKALENHC